MKSDTIVGIVGAAVLVAVMVGVFWYEVTHVEDDADDDGMAARAAFFNATYGGMDWMDDIDGDGTENYLDDDMDGDGIDNANDTAIIVRFEMTGSLGPVPASLTLGFDAGKGALMVEAWGNYTSLTPAPLPAVPTLGMELAVGDDTTGSQPTRSGSSVSMHAMIMDPIVPAAGSATVSTATPVAPTDVSIVVLVHYQHAQPMSG